MNKNQIEIQAKGDSSTNWLAPKCALLLRSHSAGSETKQWPVSVSSDFPWKKDIAGGGIVLSPSELKLLSLELLEIL